MTIDERLERLTERHEALTQTVELLSADVQQLAKNTDRTRAMVDELIPGFRALIDLVRSHESRLDRLEGTS